MEFTPNDSSVGDGNRRSQPFNGEPHMPDDGSDIGWLVLAKDKSYWKENLENSVTNCAMR